MQWFDTHAHLCDERFDDDRESLIGALPEKGIVLVMDCAAEEADWPKVRQNTEHKIVYGAYGIHPHSASEANEGYLDRLAAFMADEKARAVGEIGLDYHYDFSPRDTQKRVLREQIEWAIAHGHPVILHEREAHEDMFNLLNDYKGKLRGVLHCYSGSAEMMPRFLDLGLYLGFGGSASFKNAKKTKKAAMEVPLERILLETDCPYLAPEPYRGKRNDPGYVPVIAENIATLRNMSLEELAEASTANGKKLFGI